MIRFRHRVATASVVAALLCAACASAETVTVPYQAALAMDDACVATDALGWRTDDDDATCVVQFPLVVPVGRKLEQITVLHGTTDYAVASNFRAALDVYHATTPWQQAFDEFVYEDPIVHNAFDVQATRLMQQSGKVFPDAFTVQAATVYSVDVTASYDAFVVGIEVQYE
jgi:hypothetical protein